MTAVDPHATGTVADPDPADASRAATAAAPADPTSSSPAEETVSTIEVVDTHTAGEPTRVIVGGLPEIRGATTAQRKEDMRDRLDHLRTAVMCEPRGHADMFGSVILEPCHPEADLGVLFMDGGGYLNMCGHGTIATVTAALSTGIIEPREPVTPIILDTPAGVVRTEAHVEDGRVASVSFINVPAFVERLDVRTEVEGLPVHLDIAFGGSYFAIVRARDLGVQVRPEDLALLRRRALLLRDRLNAEVAVAHPLSPHIASIDLVEVYEETSTGVRNVVVFGRGQIDRSPCGTGTCAKLAVLHARGRLAVGDHLPHESILGTRFDGRILGTTTVAGRQAVIPQITGAAHITGYNRLVLDARDPLRHGFALGQ
ncbi:proline racemase family protein [Actinomyces howellii]|uniref:Proline racemase n=1 Tax=Actinomyces howellii TaxID=52771 RepID=A0A3S4R191_9ACTO|nr:proline racemase family protein [Actinomyces howellii]VEG28563.1 Proline racemase [Actinomyces howellii]